MNKENNPKDAPGHIGLILDGNRRWAKQRDLEPFEGHRAGVDALKATARAAFSRGVKYVSAYVFSTENWKRSKQEVNFLMNLVTKLVDSELAELEKEGIRVVILGSEDNLSSKVLAAIKSVTERTKHNTNGVLALCFNYGGQQEIVDAVKSLQSSEISPDDITVDLIGQNLYYPEIPPIDLLIRTSGEQRISNFMLWRAAYAELMFIDKYWPDFSEADLNECIEEFNHRARRFGGD